MFGLRQNGKLKRGILCLGAALKQQLRVRLGAVEREERRLGPEPMYKETKFFVFKLERKSDYSQLKFVERA